MAIYPPVISYILRIVNSKPILLILTLLSVISWELAWVASTAQTHIPEKHIYMKKSTEETSRKFSLSFKRAYE